MSGDHVDEKQPKQLVAERISDHQTAQEHANQSFLADAYDWVVDNPVKATAIGIGAVAGIGYLTRSAWMPLAARLAPEATDAAIAATGKKAALTSLAEVGAPEMQLWKTALGGYQDIGLDQAGSLLYRGAKAGSFAADNVLVVNGATEAKTLFNAVSREGLLQRNVWPKGAAGSVAEFGEIELPGKTRFIFAEGKAVEVEAGGKLIDLKNGEFHALNKDAAEKLYSGLQKF